MEHDQTLADTRERSGSSNGDPTDLARGSAVGRYLLLGRLGAGAMGEVFAAYDPELDRKVAIKLVASNTDGGGRARLLREAKALARLAHPNVVAVHDAGTLGDEVWIAMELVAGRTLTAWVAEQPRGWVEILRVLSDTARGVAAAHAAGLVHRDLKPENVMIDHDGRVRVMDFGLVHAHGREEPAIDTTLPPGELQRDSSALALRLTRADALLGTPAYMAPEQWRGSEANAAADQFGWSVLAWQLLYGELPFAGETLLALGHAVLTGKRRPPPRRRRIPGWLRSIVDRAMNLEPGRRWSTMADLLAALERGRTRARAWRAALAASSVVAIVAGLIAFRAWDHRARIAACEAAGAEIDAVWSDEQRQRLRDGFAALGGEFAVATADHVIQWIDRNAAAWRAARGEVCMNAEVHRSWDADDHERAVWCLDDRRMAIDALLGELAEPAARTLQYAVSAAASLEGMDACTDVATLRRQPAPPHEHLDEVRAVRAALSRARSLQLAEKASEAAAVLADVRVQADAIAWPPLVAAAMYREADLLQERGNYARAAEVMPDAYFKAVRAGAWGVAADAATQMMLILDMREAEAEAETWGRHAEIASEFAGDPLHLREARRLLHLAYIKLDEDAWSEVQVLFDRALALTEAALGPDHPEVAWLLERIAHNRDFARVSDSGRVLARILAIREHTLGAHHPDIARALQNIAGNHSITGAIAEAREELARALVVAEAVRDPDDSLVAALLESTASFEFAAGDYRTATALAERALAVRRRHAGPETPDNPVWRWVFARLAKLRGDFEPSMALERGSIANAEKELGVGHPNVADASDRLAWDLWRTGDWQAARTRMERNVELRALRGLDTTVYVDGLVNLGELLAATGVPGEALAHCMRAVPIAERIPTASRIVVADAHRCLARARGALGDHAGALSSHEHVVRIQQQFLGPNAPALADHLIAHATTLRHHGDHDLARARCIAALDLLERAFGRDTPPTSGALACLAATHTAAGEHAEALALSRRNLAIWETALGPDEFPTARANVLLGRACEAVDDLAAARAHHARALSVFDRLGGVGRLDGAAALAGLGRIDLAEAEPRAALARLGRAVKIFDEFPGAQDQEWSARFHLARALLASHGDRERAIREAVQARDGHRSERRADAVVELAAIEAWLAKVRPSG